MIRHFLSIALTVILLSSCGSTCNKEASSKAGLTNEGTKVEFSSLIENPDQYIGKDIIVEGKVVHVCTHSGKKLFIVGENPDVRLFISAGENMPKFSMDLLGNEVEVEGHLNRVTTGPRMAEHEGTAGKDENCDTETAVEGQIALNDIVMEFKKLVVK